MSSIITFTYCSYLKLYNKRGVGVVSLRVRSKVGVGLGNKRINPGETIHFYRRIPFRKLQFFVEISGFVGCPEEITVDYHSDEKSRNHCGPPLWTTNVSAVSEQKSPCTTEGILSWWQDTWIPPRMESSFRCDVWDPLILSLMTVSTTVNDSTTKWFNFWSIVCCEESRRVCILDPQITKKIFETFETSNCPLFENVVQEYLQIPNSQTYSGPPQCCRPQYCQTWRYELDVDRVGLHHRSWTPKSCTPKSWTPRSWTPKKVDKYGSRNTPGQTT
jgi:hypothetical protein